MPETIPELFDEAVAAVPDKVWLVAGDESFTYAEARERIGRAAAALRDGRRSGPGDLVLATMRSTPDYLFTWLASAYAGTILVTANPRSAEAELAGLVGQVRPRCSSSTSARRGAGAAGAPATSSRSRLFERRAGLRRHRARRPDDAAVMIPTSGTTGRSKLVTQTHLAYVMAGEGFPWWMELTPDDRLMTSLPLFHINAPAYSMLGSVGARAEPGAAAGLLGQHVPRRRPGATVPPSSTRSGRCSRS